ncbi:MAG: GTP-binding protein [Pseudomonadales bacterium]|nr:GTP-binding protein [Pseudomonadales bacterium]
MSNLAIQAVPTHLITGFLGAGKTSTILHLLQQRPEHERWAVLVNEFGEIGVDGSIVSAQQSAASGVFVREVAGGCMCCASQLPMQIALNQLLKQAKPHRLLIEPTGLGHPQEIVNVLTAPHYREVLALQKVVTVIDARQLSLPRYREHASFQQQLSVADLIIANKQAQYSSDDAAALSALLAEPDYQSTRLMRTDFGEVQLEMLTGNMHEKPVQDCQHSDHHSHDHKHQETIDSLMSRSLPDSGILQAVNQGEGFFSIGWRFAPELVFDYAKLLQFFAALEIERLKAVFITDQGIVAFNMVADHLSQQSVDECFESRLEIITAEHQSSWDQLIQACILQSEAC